MPAFTYAASLIAVELGAWALGSFGLSVVTGVIATGLAYITSRVINGNPNKGNNSAASAGGRIQIPPATNNKIPVVYGSAYMNGIITDARLINENKTMYYCIVLSETCNTAGATYAINDIYWNDLRLTFDSTAPYKVKDGRKNVNDANTSVEDFIDTNFVVSGNNLVQIRVYAGSSAGASQIFPATSATPAYTFWADNDGSWDSTYDMKGLVFAIVRVDYNGDKGFTGLPNMTFKVSNSIDNPADVWYDYMTSSRYGANVSATAIDTTPTTSAIAQWRDYCDELITYTPVGGGSTTQPRYTINGVIDTSRPVKDNIDIILQNGSAWLSYDVNSGLWTPIPKRAATAGELSSALQFNDDNIISGINISSTRLEDLYNQLEVEFYDKYNKDQRAYARLNLPDVQRNPNEPDNQLRMSLDLCNNNVQAELIGQIELRQSRDDLVIEFTSDHYGIQAQAGDVIAVTSSLYAWTPKLFRVMRVKEREGELGDLTAEIQALEYNPDVYAVEDITEFTTSANIGIGNLVSSVNLPKPATPTITNARPDDSIPNFTYNVLIPDSGGPFDEIEIYYTEGYDDQQVTMSVTPGTGSNGVPVGKGKMTVTSVEHNSLNVGDYFTSPSMTIESQLTGTTGGVGTYQVSLSTTLASAARTLYDQPLDADFKYLKKIVPSGNLSAFANGSTVTCLITELPSNTQTYRRYFLKARFGWKKNFGFFSANSPIDLNANITWQPNPSASGASGQFGNVTIAVTTPNTISTTTGDLILTTAAGGNVYLTTDTTGPVYAVRNTTATTGPVRSLALRSNSTGTPTVGFGTGLEYQVETAPGVFKQAGFTSVYSTDTTTGSEDFSYKIGLMQNGAGFFDRLVIGSDGKTIQYVYTGDTNTTTIGYNITANSSGTTSPGFGTAIGFSLEKANNISGNAGYISVVNTDSTIGSEDYSMNFGLMQNGATWAPKMTLDSAGNLITSGNATHKGNVILNGSTSGSVTLSAGTTPLSQTYTLPSEYPAANYYSLCSTTTGTLYWLPNGDVTGPRSATDNAVARFDGTTGKIIKNSGVIIDDSNNVIIPGNLTVDNNLVDVNTSTDTIGLGNYAIASYYPGKFPYPPPIGTPTTRWRAPGSGVAAIAPEFTLQLGGTLYVRDESNFDNKITIRKNSETASKDIYGRTNGVIYPMTLFTSSGAPGQAPGFGTGIEFTSAANESGYAGTPIVTSTIESVLTSSAPGIGSRNFKTVFKNATYDVVSTSMEIDNLGNLSIVGDLTVTGNDIKSSSGTPLSFNGNNVTANATLFLKGSSSGNVGLKAPAVAGSTTYTLPGADGTSGQFLKTDGSATLSWATASGSGSSLPAVKSESLSSQPWSVMPGCLYISSIGNALSITAQTVRYHPFYVSAPITLTEVALSVSTATTLASCNAMIYVVDVSLGSTGWQPTSNRSGGYCGEISNITTTGIKSIAGLSIVLPAGAYLFAVQFSNFTGTLQCRSLANQVITGNGYCAATSDGTTYAMTRTGVTYTSGTPATAGAWTNGAYGNAGHPGLVLSKWTVN